MRRAVVEADPEPLAIDIDRTALVVIDMQRDFLEPGASVRRSATTSRCWRLPWSPVVG